jgi:hypothetical protein
MEVHFIVKKGEILPNIESFMIQTQKNPCPPEIFNILVHKIISDFSKNPSIRNLDYPFKFCPIKATIEVVD